MIYKNVKVKMRISEKNWYGLKENRFLFNSNREEFDL